MATPAAGAVVLIRFPFSDLQNAKLRPAVVLADAGHGDAVLCQVTSNPYADKRAVELTDVSFTHGSLHRVSYARPGKLFNANETLVVREVAKPTAEAQRNVVEAVIALLRSNQ